MGDRQLERTSTPPPMTNPTHDHRQNRRKPTLRPLMTGTVANRRPVGHHKYLKNSARWRRSAFRTSVRAGWGLLPAMWGSGTWSSVPAVVKPLLLRRGPRGLEAWRLAGDADVVEDLADGVAILDDGDQLASATAFVTV